jgi:hypothetical protein
MMPNSSAYLFNDSIVAVIAFLNVSDVKVRALQSGS